MKWDIHCHTTFSDGLSTVREMFEFAKLKGLDGLVITDHDFISHRRLVQREAERTGMSTIPGTEITTPYGDILAIGIETIPSGTLEEIVEGIHEQGGVAIAAHPFGGYWTIQFTELPDIVSLFDAWEILNGGVAKEGNERAVKYAMENRLVGTTGSDAHFKDDVGSCYVEAGDDLISSIRSGKIKVGTFIDELKPLADLWNSFVGD